MKDVVIISTGIANLASVVAGLRRLGVESKVSSDPECALNADYTVLPGVGAYADGMRALRQAGLDQAVRERVSRNRKTLAICLGMQMLFEGSDEAPGVPGLGILPGRARRFSDAVPVPQLGWNDVGGWSDGEPSRACATLTPGVAYFANSYRVLEPPEGWACLSSDYDGRFVAAVERGSVVACQFHPELSGSFGRELLQRWLVSEEAVTC